MAIMRRREATPATPARREEWDPFQLMRELIGWDPLARSGGWRWAGEEGSLQAAAFDVRETKDAYVFEVDVPGFREEDIDINVTGNRLTISGRRESGDVDESDTYYCRERSYGSFTRSFTLPEGIDADEIQARLEKGTLELRVPKKPEAKPKRISLRGRDDEQPQREQQKREPREQPREGGEREKELGAR
jgi:HSP20 family protein